MISMQTMYTQIMMLQNCGAAAELKHVFLIGIFTDDIQSSTRPMLTDFSYSETDATTECPQANFVPAESDDIVSDHPLASEDMSVDPSEELKKVIPMDSPTQFSQVCIFCTTNDATTSKIFRSLTLTSRSHAFHQIRQYG